MTTFYKIFRDRNGLPATLFHGIGGSRTLPLDQWIDANVKMVDMRGSSPGYLSGFHLLPTRLEALEYLDRFIELDDKVIVQVDVDETAGIWPKVQSRERVFLAARMRVRKSQWARRMVVAASC